MSDSITALPATPALTRISQTVPKLALTAALVPLGTLAMPAQAAQSVGANTQITHNGAVVDSHTVAPNAPYAVSSSQHSDPSAAAASQAHVGGSVFLSSQIFSANTNGGGSGGMAAMSAFRLLPPQGDTGSLVSVSADADWGTVLSSGYHKFLFYIAPQFLQAAPLTTEADGPTYARTEMKVTLGAGANQQVLYHWTAELLAQGADTTFAFTPIVAPIGTFTPIYEDRSSDAMFFHYASSITAGLDLGYQAAGTLITATYTTTTFTHEISQGEHYLTSEARFGDPIDLESSPPTLFEIVTTPVQAVPEPASAAMAALGLGSLMMIRRRRQD